MTAPLAGLIVVEASGDVATRYCAKLFAEHGARVLQIHAPGNTRLAYGGASAAAYAAWLDHGKERAGAVPPTLPVDLVIGGQTPSEAARAEALAASLPGAPVALSLTWFGTTGPCASWTGSDAILQAMSGVAYAIGTADGPPTLPQGHAPQVVGGATGFIAAMAALLGRRQGKGAPSPAPRRIEISIHEAFLTLTEHGGPAAFAGAPASRRRGVNRFGPVYPQTIFPAADGWIGVTALTPQQWQGFCTLIGMPELGQDPRFETTDLRMAAADQLDDILIPAVARLAAGPMLEDGQRRHRVPLGPVPTMQDVLASPHWRERSSFRAYNGNPPAFEGPALPYRLHGRGEGAVPAGPLSGIRVLDLSMGWSGPLAGRHFADLGADVIKVEGCAHIDWWRGWNALEHGDPPPYETRSNFNAVNRNKRAITLDLRHPSGVALLKRLAEDADLLIENYAPGVLIKLGLGPDELARVNPRLSYISMGAFGSRGPWSSFRAYGSTTEQASGMPWLHGEAGWAPTMQHTAYGDPIAGIYAVCASLAALHGRHATGGTTIDLSQVECLFQLAADGIIAQSATGTAPPRTGSARATSALTATLRCAGDDAWLAVDLPDQAALARLAPIAGAATESALAAWAATRTPAEAAAALQQAGLPAGPVIPATSLLHDPHLVARGFWAEAGRRHVGRHVLPRAPYALDGAAPAITRPAPTLGEHNAEVLSDILRLPPAEIAALEQSGIIGTKAI